MQIKYFCPLWGNEHLPFKTFLAKVKDQGYDGIEMSFPFDEDEKKHLVDVIQESELQLIGQHWETVDRTFDDHRRNYEMRLRNLTGLSPLFVNSQTGKDYYSPDQNDELIALAGSIAKSSGVKIIHETHRGKFAFAAHVTQQYIERHPDLELCLDISHWCCVSETLLEDQHEAVSAAPAGPIICMHELGIRRGHRSWILPQMKIGTFSNDTSRGGSRLWIVAERMVRIFLPSQLSLVHRPIFH